jgi:hypothetical protein
MSITPRDLMSGSVVQHEGRIVKIKSVSPDFVVLEDRKEWLGGSFINGVPITEYWLQGLGFEAQDSNIWVKNGVHIVFYGVGIFQTPVSPKTYQYVHELQVLYVALMQEHLVIPKLKKRKEA